MGVGSEYRFEDSPGLRHGCGICGTPLHHPRAIKTCYGKHAEPCSRFHHTMFRIGRASSCEACKTSNQQHYKRHTAIAAVLKEIHDKSGIKPLLSTPKEISDAIHGYSEDEDFIQSDRKALDKALSRDLDLYEKVNQSQSQNPKNKNSSEIIKNDEIRQILSRLKFETNSHSKSKKEKDLLSRLVDAITEDIEVVANESRETLKRQLGYYQYADKRAYNAMIRKQNSPGTESEEDEKEEGSNDPEDDSQEKEEDKENIVPEPKPDEKAKKKPKNIDMTLAGKMKLTFISNTPNTPSFQRTVLI